MTTPDPASAPAAAPAGTPAPDQLRVRWGVLYVGTIADTMVNTARC